MFTISEVIEWTNTGTRVAGNWQTIGIDGNFALVTTPRN